MKHTTIIAAAAAASTLLFCAQGKAQTATSLFWRADSLQVSEIVSQQAVQYNFVGHHGPAVENSHCALRIYFNDSGAIDVYSKSGNWPNISGTLQTSSRRKKARAAMSIW